MTKRPLILVSSVMAIALAHGAATRLGARACAALEPIAVEYAQSSAVFVGWVKSLRIERSAGGPSEVETIATFQVEARWKGPRTSTIDIRTCGGGNVFCTVGFRFQQREKYVVFARGKKFETTQCGRTAAEAEAGETVAWLNRAKKKSAG